MDVKQRAPRGAPELRPCILALLVASLAPACSGSPDAAGSSDALSFRAGRGPCTLYDDAPVTVELWAPNHKLHLLAIDQCVPALRGCARDLAAEFTWASSDEPIDDIGDGHHSPDVFRIDPEHVCVRAERQGPKSGRVYRLGVTIEDHEAQCLVVVNHDRRGTPALDDGAQYRLSFDGADDLASCAGESDVPPGDDDPEDPRPPHPPVAPPKDAPPVSDTPDAPDPGQPKDAPDPEQPSDPEDKDGPQ